MRPTLCLLCLLAGCQLPAPPRTATAPQPFCTRTLGTAECFDAPYLLPDHPAQLADTPVRAPAPPVTWWRKTISNWQE
jgi:hypothetical protein